MGRLARGGLLRKQRARAAATEATETAAALIRALDRDEAGKIEGYRLAEALIKRDQAKRQDAIVAESVARRSELLAQALDALAAADDLPELPRMEKFHHRWTEALWRLREVAQAHEIVATKRGLK